MQLVYIRWRLDIGVVDIVHEVCAKYPGQVWSETTDKVGTCTMGKINSKINKGSLNWNISMLDAPLMTERESSLILRREITHERHEQVSHC